MRRRGLGQGPSATHFGSVPALAGASALPRRLGPGPLAAPRQRARPPLGKGGDKYYDDNEWIGLALLRRWQETRSPPLLTRANTVFQLAGSGWDPDQAHPCPGGVFFNNSPKNTDRNTVTNAPGALLGAQLYAATGNLDDLL